MDINIQLMPDWFNLGLQLVSTLILFLVVSKFGWAPMKEFLNKRAALVNEAFEKAEVMQTEAETLKAEAQTVVSEAQAEARSIVAASQEQAKQTGAEIIAAAEVEAKQKLVKATAQIDQERKAAYANIHEDLVNLAMDSAARLIEKEIDPKNHDKLFNDFVAKVGGSHE